MSRPFSIEMMQNATITELQYYRKIKCRYSSSSAWDDTLLTVCFSLRRGHRHSAPKSRMGRYLNLFPRLPVVIKCRPCRTCGVRYCLVRMLKHTVNNVRSLRDFTASPGCSAMGCQPNVVNLRLKAFEQQRRASPCGEMTPPVHQAESLRAIAQGNAL
jgi:hypothetical protein